MRTLAAYTELIGRALHEQQSGLPSGPPGPQAAELVQHVVRAIESALGSDDEICELRDQ